MRSRVLIEELSEAEVQPNTESTRGNGVLARSHLMPLIAVLSSSDTIETPTAEPTYAAEGGEGVPTPQSPSLPAPGSAGSAGARLPLTCAAVQSTEGALRAVPLPAEQVYAPVGGAPDAATSPAQPEAQHCSAVAAQALRLLADSIAQLAPTHFNWPPDTSAALVQHDSQGAPASAPAGGGAQHARGGLRPGLLIEELEEAPEPPPPQPQRVCAVEIVLLCGLYGADSRLDGPWVTPATADAAAAALKALAAKLPLAQTCSAAVNAPEAGSEAAGQHLPSARVQALIGRLLPSVLQRLRAVRGHSKKLRDESLTTPTQGARSPLL